MRKILRLTLLVAILALVPATVVWVVRSEMSHLWWAVPVMTGVSVFLIGLWYLACGGAPLKARLRRIGLATLALLGLAVVAAATLRYEGSTSGS
ncbi:MAG: hypothetical protein KDN18_23455, partial [Verrucomicrobiae bacterium]|nr:hypothetical protein [Verrucomicrobiae bacterium]